MAVGSHKELSSLGSQKHRCCVRLAALCSFSSDVVLPRARCTTRLWALLLVIASAPRTRPLTPYAAAAAPSGLGAAPAARPPFSIKTPQRRFSGFQFSRPPPCLPVRGLFEKINLQEKRPATGGTRMTHQCSTFTGMKPVCGKILNRMEWYWYDGIKVVWEPT